MAARGSLKNFGQVTTRVFVRFQHAANARTLDVEVCKGQGVKVWDKNGKEYLDFIGGGGSLIMGHCHPKLLQSMHEQMNQLHMTSRSYQNNVLPEFSTCVCQQFNYDKVLMMNSGTEACETAIKLARIWGYVVKKICPKEAVILFPRGTYWGNTITACSCSVDPLIFNGFQPLVKGMKIIPYNDPCTLEESLKNPNVCAFFMDPIQTESEAGLNVPTEGYLTEVRRMCTQNKVLWICNETFTGMGRTGMMLGVDHENVKPDILVLGKGLGAGLYPVSAVLSSCEVIDLLKPGAHSSTYGGNPLGARVALQTMRTLKEEGVVENCNAMGALLRDGLLCSLDKDDMPALKGRGLVIAINIDPRIGTACEIGEELKDCGLLAWPCRDEFIRFSPPLIVCEEEITQAVGIVKRVVDHMKGNGDRK